MNSDNLKFISNNVRGIQKSEKRIKIFEYLKNSISPYGSIFHQEIHTSVDDKKGGVTILMVIYIFSRKN